MIRRVLFTIVIAGQLLAAVALAEEPKPAAEKKKGDAFDLICEDAVLAIAINNVPQLIERGDKFIEKTEFKTPFRLTDGYRFVLDYVGIKHGIDKEGAAALMAMKWNPDGDFFQSLVLAVPISDLDVLARKFEIEPKVLADSKVIDRQMREGLKNETTYVRYAAVRGHRLLIGASEEGVALAVKGKTLREALPAEDLTALARHDILLYANPKQVKKEWPKDLFGLDRALDKYTPDEAEALKEISSASEDVKYALAGLRLDEGLGAEVVLQFEGEKSREVLTRLGKTGKAKSSLAGLPGGRVLAGYAASGDGGQSSAVARALLHVSLAGFIANTQEIVSAGHRPNLVGLFGEVWQRLEGSRTALYENDNPQRDGQFSLMAVLETDDAPKFIADMTGLARFIHADALSPEERGDALDAKTIAALVAELGHDEYRVRQSASAKLGLIGPAALPALELAAKSTDAEVRFRAIALREQIQTLVTEERQDLLKRDLLWRVKPNFVYFPKQETRSGRPVDFVSLRLNTEEATYAAQLKRLLGPEWNKLRLATVDRRVVVLLGSNTALFDKALANLQSGEKGLDADARFATFRTRAPVEQNVEFHLSLARAAELAAPDADAKPRAAGPPGITSFGLSLAPQRVRFHFFSPFEEVKTVIKKSGW